MKPFITDSFLLHTPRAEELFHTYAEHEPIIDYHTHLPPSEIARDARFENIARIWLYGDHYKWRLMRANGIEERFCTGDASDWEKFNAWAQTVPKTVRNPLYHWTHLELARYFGIDDLLLGPDTAARIWERCNRRIGETGFSVRGLLKRMKVSVVCTTDDPCDSLEHHALIARDGSFGIRVFPSFRPDKAMAVEQPRAWNGYIDTLSRESGMDIGSLTGLLEALDKRHEFFHDRGCRLSDHGLDTVYADPYDGNDVESIFAILRHGREVSAGEAAKFKSAVLYECATMDHSRGWVQQLHIGALRNTCTRLFAGLGPDAGGDSIGDAGFARPLAPLLDRLDRAHALPKTIVYNLNPRDNFMLAAMIGSFQDGSIPGRMQLGSAWWFLDHKQGMEAQMDALSSVGLLSRFVGMLTDSRSFLSFPRHEYFRRILCGMLGDEMKNGLIPDDMELIGEMVRDICSRNALSYFAFGTDGEGG